MGSLVVNFYDNSIYPVTYTIGRPGAGEIVLLSKWDEVYNYINKERTRRGQGSMPYYNSSAIYASNLTQFSNYINFRWSDGQASAGTYVTATGIDYVIDKINALSTECICNCNYCTCNCNYCTCNCDYACTCNCNY